MDLQEIMDDTIELPLDVHLLLFSQGKTIQPQGMSDVGEHGLRCPDPLAVYESTQRGVNLVLHLLSVGFLPLFHFARKVVHLPGFSSIRVFQASRTKFTHPADRFSAAKLDRVITITQT